MRVLARIGFTLTALSLAAPSGARAGLPIVAGMPWSPAQQMSAAEAAARKAPPRLCADCLRKKMLKEGVNVPPAPPLPPGAVVPNNKCSVCGRPAAVNAGSVSRSRRSAAMPVMADRSLPGRAVVGGEPPAYVASGNDPAPIGVVAPRFAAAGPAVPRDASVMPTAAVSSPSDPLMPTPEKQPHILTHLLGLSGIGRESAERRERRNEEKHARIAYGAGNAEPVQNVPASAVYGR